MNIDKLNICSNHEAHNGFSQCLCALSIASQMKNFVDNNLVFVNILINAVNVQKNCQKIMERLDASPETSSNLNRKRDYIFIDFVEFSIDEPMCVYKEFCIISADFKHHSIIKSPSPFDTLLPKIQESILWQTTNSNGLSYDSGNISFKDVVESTYKQLSNKKIVVEDRYKAQCLKNAFSSRCDFECIPLEDLGYNIDYDECPRVCDHHGAHNSYSYCRCALSLAEYLKLIVENDFLLMDTLYNTFNIKKNCHQYFK